MGVSQTKSKSLGIRKTDGIVCVQRLVASRPQKDLCFHLSLKAGGKNDVLF